MTIIFIIQLSMITQNVIGRTLIFIYKKIKLM